MRVLCRILEVTESGYYQWRKKPESARAKQNRELLDTIRIIHAESRQTYGRVRVERDLEAQGIRCNHKRVGRLMREANLRAKQTRKFKATTDSRHSLPVAPNLLERNFSTTRPNEVWVGDITAIWTDEGWTYLVVFLDLFSRMVVGWAVSARMTADVVNLALERAIARRRPGKGLMVHTDRGSQFASHAFRNLLERHGFMQSMSRKGDCWDNAVVESFFHSFKGEVIYGERWETRLKVEMEVFDYIEDFYNRRRRHSATSYLAPLDYERRYAEAA